MSIRSRSLWATDEKICAKKSALENLSRSTPKSNQDEIYLFFCCMYNPFIVLDAPELSS